MYRRSCPIGRVTKATNPYCPPTRSPGSAISESARMAKQICPTAIVTTQVGPACTTSATDPTTGEPVSRTARVIVPVTPGGPVPYVQVGTVPARITTQQTASAVLGVGYDPYNPATRFRQYFPPAPLPYICPERIPNNLPIPTSVCVPVTRYEGSLAEARREAQQLEEGVNTPG
jgi:hypothetical protein